MPFRSDRFLQFPDQAALLAAAAGLTEESLAVSEPSLNLTGGSTIGNLYRLLAQGGRIDWPAVTFTWGDERFVPPGHPDHNGTQAQTSLFNGIDADPAKVHPIPTTGGTPEECAQDYDKLLLSLVRTGRPLFDLTLLSLGEDGHIASLLPGQPVLGEQSKWVAAVPHGRPEVRISLTYPALRQSGRLILIASGKAKAPVLREILAGSDDYPASKLAANGELILLADEAALEG